MDELLCDTFRDTYNANVLDLDENKIIGKEFDRLSKIHRDSKKGNKILMDLVYNHYNQIKPFPAFIGGPQTLTMHWSKTYKKIIYIFGEQHLDKIDCEKRFEDAKTKKWISIEDFFEDLIHKTDVYLDIYFEFPAIKKLDRRYYESFKPFPTGSRMYILFQSFKKYVQPGTKNDEDCSKLIRVHYFDSRVEDQQGTGVGVDDINWFSITIFNLVQLSIPSELKKLAKENTRFKSVLNGLASKDEKLLIEFWMKQYKENKYNAEKLLNCPLNFEILNFIEDELKLEFRTDNSIKIRAILVKYIPYILDAKLDDDDILKIFDLIYESITIPKAFTADVYTLASIFKDLENVTNQPTQQNSVIIYGGNAHSEIYRKFLKRVLFKELIIAGKPSAGSEQATCVDMEKLDEPFFSDWTLIADSIINLDSSDGYKINRLVNIISQNITLIYEGNKIPCTIKTVENTINIRIMEKKTYAPSPEGECVAQTGQSDEKDDEGKGCCLDFSIDNVEKIAEIDIINVAVNHCPLPKSSISQGSFLLRLVDEICGQLDINTVTLLDDSHITCNGKKVNLEFLSLMKYGKSWYELQGFSYKNEDKKDIVDHIRKTSLDKIIEFLLTFDTNKQLALKTKWREEDLEYWYDTYPEFKDRDYVNTLYTKHTLTFTEKLIKEKMDKDYDFSTLPDKINIFFSCKKEYDKKYKDEEYDGEEYNTVSHFLTYVWSKNCSEYLDIVSILCPEINGLRSYMDEKILLDFPNDENDLLMIKHL